MVVTSGYFFHPFYEIWTALITGHGWILDSPKELPRRGINIRFYQNFQKKAWNQENAGHLKYPKVENSDFALNVNVSLTILILNRGGSRLFPEVRVFVITKEEIWTTFNPFPKSSEEACLSKVQSPNLNKFYSTFPGNRLCSETV